MASYLTNHNVYKQFPIIRNGETQAEQQLESFSVSSMSRHPVLDSDVTIHDSDSDVSYFVAPTNPYIAVLPLLYDPQDAVYPHSRVPLA